MTRTTRGVTTTRRARGITVVAIGLAAVLTLSACGGGGQGDNPLEGGQGGDGKLVVGSANFPENRLLGEIYAQALEADDIEVTRQFNIGSREVYYDQVVKGSISVMPEYNGALLVTSVDEESTAVTTDQINTELKEKLPDSVELLRHSEAQSKDSVTVNRQVAQRHNLRSIADLKPVAGNMVIGGPSEFETRQHGLPGLREKYGVEFRDFQPFDAGAQTLVTELDKNNIQAADLFTTDPAIKEHGFVVLDDPENVFNEQNVVPLVHEQSVNQQVRKALNDVSAELTTQDLLDMNVRVSVDKDDPEQVAKDWLTDAGLA